MGAAAANITVILKNTNTSMQVDDVEVYDRICNRQVGVFRLQGGTSVSIQICADSTGKGSVAIRNSDSEWAGIPFIRAGDTISR